LQHLGNLTKGEEEMKKIFLDLQSVELYGWEREKSLCRVQAYLSVLRSGSVFAPLKIWRIRDGRFHLDKDSLDAENPALKDGGHHRALAYYLAKRALPAIITQELSHLPSYSYRIQDLELVEVQGKSMSVDAYGRLGQ